MYIGREIDVSEYGSLALTSIAQVLRAVLFAALNHLTLKPAFYYETIAVEVSDLRMGAWNMYLKLSASCDSQYLLHVFWQRCL